MAASLDAHQVGLPTESQKSEIYCLFMLSCIYCGKWCCAVQNVSTMGQTLTTDPGTYFLNCGW